ncbi:DUF6216 family protein [Pseudomonas chlororaphis]
MLLLGPLKNYATAVSICTGITIFAAVLYIYARSGSLLFLRDLMWRFFGGTISFENKNFEKMRKNLRELEYFRFEFNIPASTLEDAQLAEQWINQNSLSPRDVAWVKKYIDWSDFNTLKFKENLFARWITTTKVILILVSIFLVSISAALSTSDYLMVHLKNEPNTPSFYLSEDNIKFELFKNKHLTLNECKSSESLNKLKPTGFSEKNLDTICAILIDSKYIEHVHNGLKEQKYFLLLIGIWSLFSIFGTTNSIGKQFYARGLNKKLQSQTSTMPSTHP